MKTEISFDHEQATSDLSQCDAGRAILAHAKERRKGDIDKALSDAYDGELGRAAAELSARLPKYQIFTEVEMTSADLEKDLQMAIKAAEKQARRERLTALVISAITTGNASVRDTGSDSVSETTLFGGEKIIFVFKAFQYKEYWKKLQTPNDAREFIDFTDANYYGKL